jgi:TonB family protein
VTGSFLKSILIHVSCALAMTWVASQDSFLIEGQPGRSGNPGETSLVVWTDPIEVVPEKQFKTELQTELPSDVKVAQPREIDIEAEPTAKARDSGSGGQMGSGSQPALKIGNSDRSNLLGLHTAAIHKKVQSNLKTPGFLVYSLTTQLKILILKSGEVSKLEVLKSSGSPDLDLIALESVKKSAPFPPFERDLTIVIPVIFRSR